MRCSDTFLGPGCQPKVGILDLLLAMFMVCPMSVRCPSVGHADELRQNGRTDRDAVWHVGWGGPQAPCIRWGPGSPKGRGPSRHQVSDTLRALNTYYVCCCWTQQILHRRGRRCTLVLRPRSENESERQRARNGASESERDFIPERDYAMSCICRSA